MLKLRLALVPALMFSVQTALAQEADTPSKNWLEFEHTGCFTTNLPALPRA